MTMPNSQERRVHDRRQVELTATVSVDGHQTILKTRDLSSGGAFLRKGESPLPPQGAELFVEIAPMEGDDEPMVARAEVVHVTPDGIGIIFLE